MKYLSLLFLMLLIQGLSGQVDTLSSYASFQFYSGDKDTVYLDHPRYYGLFVKGDCSSENYATRMLSQSACYVRLERNYKPRFLELGRASPLPILGGVMVEEVDAINGAAFLAFSDGGDTILMDTIYEIDQPVYLFDNVTYLGSSATCGFVRSKPPVTVLTNIASSGDNMINVESVSGFRKFHRINIFSGKGYDQLSSFTSYTASVSAILGGDTTLFLSGLKVQKEMQVGDTVSLLYPMMLPLFTTTNNILIENLTFDGNREYNGFSNDWRVATTIVSPSAENLVIKNCLFREIPSENIFLCGATLIDCKGEGFNGSTAHFSCQEGDFPTQVLYNEFSDTNQAGDSIMEHSEGAFTFSAKVQDLRVSYNTIEKIEERGIGDFANDDFRVEVTDNVFDTPKEIVGYVPFYDKDSLNTIYNNKNLKQSNLSTSNCLVTSPQERIGASCDAMSSLDDPLEIGDTITIILDSLKVVNTNENYLKCIEPLYSLDYFTLLSISLQDGDLSSFHEWIEVTEGESCQGLVFDNGHRSGLFGLGNWGYEGCENGNCNGISLKFVVHTLPENTKEVECPLNGMRLRYDGELETWDYKPTCVNTRIEFSENLGRPVLNGTTAVIDETGLTFSIDPNPVRDLLRIKSSDFSLPRYQVVSSYGKKFKTMLSSNEFIDVSHLAAGLYYITFELEGKTIVQKFIKL